MLLTHQEINEFAQRKLKGEEYSIFRKELTERNFSSSEIKTIIQEIDFIVLSSETKKSDNKLKIQYKLIGVTLMLIGGGITGLTYFGAIDLKGRYIFMYGPILAGYSIVFIERFKKR